MEAGRFVRGVEPELQRWFDRRCPIQWRNHPVEDAYIHDREAIA
jgi:hypothetical protein